MLNNDISRVMGILFLTPEIMAGGNVISAKGLRE